MLQLLNLDSSNNLTVSFFLLFVQAPGMDFDKLEAQLKTKMVQDDRYWRENDAKFRAAKQMATYEEFVDIVKVSKQTLIKMMTSSVVKWF